MVKTEKKEEIKDNFEEKLYRLFIPLTSKIEMKELEEKLRQADDPDELEFYLSKYLFFAIFVPLLLMICGSFFFIFLNMSQYLSNFFIFCIFLIFLIIIYALINPYLQVGSKVSNIKNSLPLAILSMSSIAESGAPPETMFHTSALKTETPHLSKEFEKLRGYINLGLSLPQAIDELCAKTPSPELKKFLLELKSSLESGGSLPEFMKKKAEHAQFTYKLMLDGMNKRAETFGDIYSAIVIAGPLFLFSSIMLLGMIGGGGFGGMSIETLMIIGVFGLVPLINICFIIILQFVS